jgi:hypothetical protein
MPATAMPFGLLSQVCHTACSSFAFVRAATVSFTPFRSLLPSFRFITPRSQLHICFIAGHPCSQAQSNTQGCTSHSQANATVLTGFHSAALCHSFTSVAFSPPAAYYLARRPPTSAAFTLRLLIAHSYLISQSTAKVHLHSSSRAVCFAKFTARGSYGAGIAAATWLSFFSLTR